MNHQRQKLIPIILAVILCHIAVIRYNYNYYDAESNKYKYTSTRNVDVLKEVSQLTISSNTTSANTTSSIISNKKLEFIHIPKTGGSAIELEASKKGITWGACHYIQIESNGDACQQPDLYDQMKQNRGYDKTKVPFDFEGSFGEPWHTPPHWFNHYPFRNDTAFTVVRDPYSRAVSHFYCKYKGMKGTKEQMNNATVMNQWLRDLFTDITIMKLAHFLPQHHYVYDINGIQLVHNVLKLENLNEEFSILMKQYNINVTLPQESKFNARNSSSALTVKDLDSRTISLINDVYLEDFIRFNYSRTTNEM